MLRLRSARTSVPAIFVRPERSAKRVVEGRLPFLALLLAGCSSPEPTIIDGSSPQAFAATAEQARRNLSPADRLDFDRALTTLPARRHSAADPEALRRSTFGGMTGSEVVADYRSRQ